MPSFPHPFTQNLLSWYEQHGRSLPWRQTRDPYKIWISEIILQQTRVAQGYDYYLRFIERFPTVEALATATQNEVMQQWEGLGYYSRARNLHAAAQSIVAQGRFPQDYTAIRALKGVGDYTAAAIASFAYDLPYAVVDGNVYRVLARYFGIDTPIDSSVGKKAFAQLAQSLLATERPADYNQAIMDFGALQCSPKKPNCLLCPLAESCHAFGTQQPERYPVKTKKIAVKERYFAFFFLATTAPSPQLLLHRRDSHDIWAGLYESLCIECPQAPTLSTLSRHPLLSDLLALPHATLQQIGHQYTHQLTHRRLQAQAFRLAFPPAQKAAIAAHLGKHQPEAKYSWVKIDELQHYAFPKLLLRMLEIGFGHRGTR